MREHHDYVEAEIQCCSAEHHAELVKSLRETMARIREKQSVETCEDESLVKEIGLDTLT